MATLKDLIGSIQYDFSWGIWAEVIDGRFHADAPARIGQCASENGGWLDGWKFFADGVQCGDSFRRWNGEFCLSEWEAEWDRITILWEQQNDAPWDGDIDPILDWAESQKDGEVSALVESARQKWADQVDETSDEWIESFIGEVNESQQPEYA